MAPSPQQGSGWGSPRRPQRAAQLQVPRGGGQTPAPPSLPLLAGETRLPAAEFTAGCHPQPFTSSPQLQIRVGDRVQDHGLSQQAWGGGGSGAEGVLW